MSPPAPAPLDVPRLRAELSVLRDDLLKEVRTMLRERQLSENRDVILNKSVAYKSVALPPVVPKLLLGEGSLAPIPPTAPISSMQSPPRTPHMVPDPDEEFISIPPSKPRHTAPESAEALADAYEGWRSTLPTGLIQDIEEGWTARPEEDEAMSYHVSVGGSPRGGNGQPHAQAGAFGSINLAQDPKWEEETYDVTRFYHKTGWAQAWAKSEVFINVTLAVIVVNSLYLGIDAEFNRSSDLLSAKLGFQLCELFFCVFFTGEWVVRFFAFASKVHCLHDMWFKFDTFLVALIILETFFLPIISLAAGGMLQLPTGPLRLLRLLRLSRLARLLRSLPELLTMMKAVSVATRAVASSLLMVSLLIYVFAIGFHMFLKDEPSVAHLFGSLPRCAWTLLMDGTLLDSTGDTLDSVLSLGTFSSYICVFLFMLFILLSATTVMNMLIGILCEVVSAVAAKERDDCAVAMIKDSILEELKRADADGNRMLSQTELANLMQQWKRSGAPNSLDIDMQFLVDAQQLLYKQGCSEVEMGQVMDQMLLYRGDNAVTVEHMIAFSDLIHTRVCASVEKILAMGVGGRIAVRDPSLSCKASKSSPR